MKVLRKLIAPLMVVLLIAIATTVVLMKRKHITVMIDGNATNIITFKNTVQDALTDKEIVLGPKDKITPALTAEIKDKDTVTIKRAVNIQVKVDGKDLKILSAEENIASVLALEGITLKQEDKISLPKETKLYNDLKVEIIRVENKTLTETLPIEFNTVTKTDSSLANTKKKITQEGSAGEKQKIYNVVYENGVEVSRTLASETVTKKPVNKIIVQGTYPLMPVSRGGDPMSYKKVFTARATAYWAVRGVGKTYTASGRLAVRNPEGYSTIAVDPRLIPYGTKLFVEGYGFAIAADTGTGIKGEKIDVYFNTLAEARRWAVKYVKVYILK